MIGYYGTHLCMRWDDLTQEEADTIRHELTFRNLAKENQAAFGRGRLDEEAMLTRGYLADDEHVWVPRGYILPESVRERLEVVDERTCSFERLEFPEHTIQLRENQVAPVTALLENGGDMLLQLGCGKGKTEIALYYAAEQGYKTLIIVDRYDLADQWLDRICGSKDGKVAPRFPGLPRKAVGRFFGGKHTIGEHFTVATIQTIARLAHELGDEWFNQWGLVIFDEAHVLGGDGSFGSVPPLFPGHRLALTATPERKDGLTKLMFYTFGGPEPVYKDVVRDTPATWVFASLPPLVDPFALEGMYRWTQETPSLPARKTLKAPEYITAASKNEAWIERIIQDAVRAVEHGRSVLILGERVEQMRELADKLQERDVFAFAVVGPVSRKERKERLAYGQVICATWQLAGKGLDVPQLDTLFLLNTYDDGGRLMQEKGRVDARGREGKKDPLVLVYCHDQLPGTKWKRDAMMRTIRERDEGATIRTIRVTF